MSNSKKLISHTSIYMAGDVLRRTVSIIMLPIYTKYLTTEDYGTVELLSMLIDFASIIFGARVGQAVFRYYCTAETAAEKNAIISSALFLSTITNAIGVTAVILLADEISTLLFASTQYSTIIQLFALTMLLEPFMQIPLTHIKADQRPWLFLIFSITKLAIQLSLNIYFIIILDMHVEGVIYSAVISGAIMSAMLTTYSLSKTGFSINPHRCKNLFSFSLPLKIATLGSFYLAFGDRYILNLYTDLSQVGIYALGYKFGFIFLVLAWDPFQNFWDSEKYNVLKKHNAVEIYSDVFLLTSIFLVTVGLIMSLFTKDLLTIMSDPSYIEAHEIVPIIILAHIVQAWTKYCSIGILLKQKTSQIAYAEAAGVAVITCAYFLLIPMFGIHGAAWATVIGFSARFLWTYITSQKYYTLKLPWPVVAKCSFLAMTTYLSSFFIPDEIFPSIACRMIVTAIFLIALYYLPIIPDAKKHKIKSQISHILGKQ